MAWEVIYRDTDKTIERDHETEEERITWANTPAARIAQRVEALPDDIPRIDQTTGAIIDTLAESLGVIL